MTEPGSLPDPHLNGLSLSKRDFIVHVGGDVTQEEHMRLTLSVRLMPGVEALTASPGDCYAMPRFVACPSCLSSGRVQKIEQVDATTFRQLSEREDCRDCGGTGRADLKPKQGDE